MSVNPIAPSSSTPTTSSRKSARPTSRNWTRPRYFRKPIVTQVVPLKGFYDAESYHQDYALHNPNNPYIMVCDRPKVEALKQQFPELFKDYKGK